ncbi:MAG: metallopeptidase TldD-related protein [Candidatus Hodarchaeota archaeon]
MTNAKIDLIENNLKAKNIEEYEIYFIDKTMYETIFLKNQPETEREVEDFEYFIRILTQKGDQTGVGIVKGNSLNPKEIKKYIDTCYLLSKNNISSIYHFPEEKSISSIVIADKVILKDPIGIKNDFCEELMRVVEDQKDVVPTFGRLRVHINNNFLRNSNGVNLDSINTFFYLEHSLKAQKNGKLSEYWTTQYFKEKEHLNFEERIGNWAKIAKDTLLAELPKPNKEAIVILPPHVLKEAITPVIGLHASGQGFSEKVSAYNIDDKVASDEITIIDDGLLEGGLRSNSWDGEGNPHQKTEVIKNGIFQKRLYDQKYAMLNNVESTGNGMRSQTGSVLNRVSNLQIIPGTISIDEIISDIKEGYYIEKFSWLSPEELSGFFGAEIRNGYYIKNGEFKNPIKLGNVSGNVLEMIKNCLYVSKEREFSSNSLFPYMVFSDLTVSI